MNSHLFLDSDGTAQIQRAGTDRGRRGLAGIKTITITDDAIVNTYPPQTVGCHPKDSLYKSYEPIFSACPNLSKLVCDLDWSRSRFWDRDRHRHFPSISQQSHLVVAATGLLSCTDYNDTRRLHVGCSTRPAISSEIWTSATCLDHDDSTLHIEHTIQVAWAIQEGSQQAGNPSLSLPEMIGQLAETILKDLVNWVEDQRNLDCSHILRTTFKIQDPWYPDLVPASMREIASRRHMIEATSISFVQ